MTSAEITLLVPCFNAARFLPRLMESVRAQSQPFTRILCYDDGSTDDTAAVARALGLEILTGNANRGVAHARNQLAKAATTEWIHFHDADDLIARDFVERMAPCCDARHDVVCCDADWIDEISRKPVIVWRYDSAELARDPAAHLLVHPLGLNNSILRRSAWLESGGCDEALAMWEDADVHFRLALAGARFHYVPVVLTWSLRRGESFSHDYRRNWNCRLRALTGYCADPRARRLAGLLGAEAEKAASQLLLTGDPAAAGQALALCRQVGHRVPTTQHPALRLLRMVLPPLTALRLREWIRRRAATRLARS